MVRIRLIQFRAILSINFLLDRTRARDWTPPEHTHTRTRRGVPDPMSFAVQTPNRGASRATVRQAGELEALGEGVARCVKRTIDTSPAATLRIAIKSRFAPGRLRWALCTANAHLIHP